MIMKKATTISFLIFSNLLGGCSTNHKNLDCPLGKGMQCSSISRVNQAVNEGRLEEINPSKPAKMAIPQLSFQQADEDNLPKKFEKKVTRIPEKTLRIWLSGFTDEQGDYVEETYAHIVSESGQWHEEE
jgi:hypothetical protein